MKKIVILGILIIVIFSGVQLIDNNKSEKDILKPISQKEVIFEVVKGSDISYYNQKEIVLLYEIKAHLYKNFKITYDEFKDVYNEYFYVGPNIDDEYFAGVQNINFIGLSIEETRDLIRESGEYDLDWIDEINVGAGEDGYLMLVSEVIPGYDDDESIVYVRKEVKIPEGVNGAKFEYTTYRHIKYNFKEVNGEYKIFTRRESFVFDDGMFGHKLSEEEFNSEMKKFEDIYNVEGGLHFPFRFDIKEFCETYFY